MSKSWGSQIRMNLLKPLPSEIYDLIGCLLLSVQSFLRFRDQSISQCGSLAFIGWAIWLLGRGHLGITKKDLLVYACLYGSTSTRRIHPRKIQAQECEIRTDLGPSDMFRGFVQNYIGLNVQRYRYIISTYGIWGESKKHHRGKHHDLKECLTYLLEYIYHGLVVILVFIECTLSILNCSFFTREFVK